MKCISISDRSKKLIEQLHVLNNTTLLAWRQQTSNELERDALIAWLGQEVECDKKTRFLVESLRAALLEDLSNSFLSSPERNIKKNVSWFAKAQFAFLAAAGTLVAICEGFDGIATLLGSLAVVPTAAIFISGVLFSLLSVGIFYGFDLMEISKLVGVSFKKSSKLLDVFLEQVEEINKLKKIIDDRYADESLDAADRLALKRMLAMLISRHDALDEARQSYLAALNNPGLRLARLATATMTALIFFSGGFFTGQTLALTVAGLFAASVAATFWPIVVASAVVGVAALFLYWRVQRPGLENLFGKWLGFDKDNIQAFADDEVVEQEKEELSRLEQKLTTLEQLHHKVDTLNKEVTSLRPKKEVVIVNIVTAGAATVTAASSPVIPSGFFGGRPRSSSLGTLVKNSRDLREGSAIINSEASPLVNAM